MAFLSLTQFSTPGRAGPLTVHDITVGIVIWHLTSLTCLDVKMFIENTIMCERFHSLQTTTVASQ